jgi:hypothetical protein
MYIFRIFCFVAAVWLAPQCLARDVAVITHHDNAASVVSSVDLVKLFKADMQKWPDGKKVTIFLSDPTTPDCKVVLQKLYKMTAEEIKALAASHKGEIMILPSDDLVLKAVAEHPGALGVVNVYSINSAVKVLKVDGKLPLEQGYLLHGN